MKVTNLFNLKMRQLKEIAESLKGKVEIGLNHENTEIQCIPTFISPKTDNINGKALVLDLGGTNYRAALVEFKDGKTEIHPENGWKKDLSIMKQPGFTEEQLYKAQADLISEMKTDDKMPIGYCFSYPAESIEGGDANLLRWTKGVNIKEMVGKPVGKPLMDYLNNLNNNKYSGIKVINDTVASLFAGLTDKNYDAWIGLIVGTGTNMATFIKSEKIGKLGDKVQGLIPVNLESGNFHPPHLTDNDDRVDACSINKGAQRFEKAVSGMYLGEILKSVFPNDEFEDNFDAQVLTRIMNYPDRHKQNYVDVARSIYRRSAQLVAASIAGLVLVMREHDPSIKNIRLTAEGSLFWSKDRYGLDYNNIVWMELKKLLIEFGHNDVNVDICSIENANLIGSAIAAFS